MDDRLLSKLGIDDSLMRGAVALRSARPVGTQQFDISNLNIDNANRVEIQRVVEIIGAHHSV